ncbi:helix-turn-helix domain-containing protein [Micromonospora carbonacea]|uniref:Helix-turn-helix domain-containing protein n=1 Tax=Micromonospora carbonacea TaxID=47853 RepID=A0A1C5ADG8_9ACTN|nr:helix-turn-helix domain-containing protein [Micromonospora carbonacea]SCF43209.1 Helix-turn-helix domain-containing protein [Micromonospora carbonacea]
MTAPTYVTPAHWTFPDLSARMAGVAQDPADWQRLGRHIVRRREQLGLTQAAVHAAGGPSTATQRNLENGAQTSYRSSLLRQLERVLRWPDGTIDAILAGGDPPGDTPFDATVLAELEKQEPELRRTATNVNRSEPLRAWARALLHQIDQLREAEQREVSENDRRAS